MEIPNFIEAFSYWCASRVSSVITLFEVMLKRYFLFYFIPTSFISIVGLIQMVYLPFSKVLFWFGLERKEKEGRQRDQLVSASVIMRRTKHRDLRRYQEDFRRYEKEGVGVSGYHLN